jgi:hypothetical protein
MTDDEYRKALLAEITENKDIPKSRGKTMMIKYLKGEKLTASQSLIAQCFCCNGYFMDGMEDCEDPTCPLYAFYPYKRKKGESNRGRKAKNV